VVRIHACLPQRIEAVLSKDIISDPSDINHIVAQPGQIHRVVMGVSAGLDPKAVHGVIIAFQQHLFNGERHQIRHHLAHTKHFLLQSIPRPLCAYFLRTNHVSVII